MVFFKERKCKEIIARLNRVFQSNQGNQLIQKIGAIDQDFINRGLFNSTARIAELVHAHYDYISSLKNFLLESIERDYSHLSPMKCKPHLRIIIEREYIILDGKLPGWLHESQLYDEGIRVSFERGVQNKKEEAMVDLDDNCSLWDKRWRLKKKQKRIEFSKWLIGPGIGFVIIVWLFRVCFPPEEQSAEATKPVQDRLKVLSVDPNTGKTVLFVRTRERVDGLREFIIKEKIDPWLFLWHRSFKVTKFDGSIIEYPNLEYGGSLRAIFWGQDYIDPFLKEGIQQVLDETGKECRVNQIRAEEPVKEAGALLAGIIRNIYDRMAEVDSKLLKKREGSEKVSKKNVEDRIRTMDKYLREQLQAALELYSGSAGEV